MSLGRNFSFETNHRKDFWISTKSNLMIIGNSSWHFGWPPACNLRVRGSQLQYPFNQWRKKEAGCHPYNI